MPSALAHLPVIANVVCAVGIVLANKHLMSGHQFSFVTTLTFLHFGSTAVATHLLLYFEVQHIICTRNSVRHSIDYIIR